MENEEAKVPQGLLLFGGCHRLLHRSFLSIGRINYIVNSLIRKGFVKARTFRNSGNKLAYRYLLTPKGVAKKVELTRAFLARKMAEYDDLVREIDELKREVGE